MKYFPNHKIADAASTECRLPAQVLGVEVIHLLVNFHFRSEHGKHFTV